MKSWRCFFSLATIIIFLLVLVIAGAMRRQPGHAGLPVSAGVVISDAAGGGDVLTPYRAVLREEGFPWVEIAPEELDLPAGELVQRYPALILPEGLNQVLPAAQLQLLGSYVQAGGKVLLVYDAGIRGGAGETLPAAGLADLAGVSYEPGPAGQKGILADGYWQFSSAREATAWGITPGKLDRDNAILSYGYDRLKYRHYRVRLRGARTVAFDGSDGQNPVITEKTYPSGGAVIFVNLPLGYYKDMSDDLPLRSVLRTFLIRYAHLPRVVNTPQGRGGW